MLRFTIALISIILLASCGGKVEETITGVESEIKDLPFARAKEGKEYADLILKAIKTNRDNPIYKELTTMSNTDEQYFNSMIGMYSTGISGRDDWDFRDVYAENEGKGKSAGYDYAWLDPRGRLGIQIYIEPVQEKGRYKLAKLELRSRLDVMKSVAFPGGDIEDYKKLAFNWEQD